MTSAHHRPGARLLGSAWIALLVAGLASGPLATEMAGRFGAGLVVLRDWMVLYGTVVAAAHLAIVLAALAGAARARWVPAAARATAIVALACAALTLAGLLAFPHTAGTGPWPHDAAALQVLRGLVFAPSLLTGVASIALLLSLGGRVPAALATLDLGLCAHAALTTPLAVVPRLHPHAGAPLLLAPWLLAGAALAWLALRRTP